MIECLGDVDVGSPQSLDFGLRKWQLSLIKGLSIFDYILYLDINVCVWLFTIVCVVRVLWV